MLNIVKKDFKGKKICFGCINHISLSFTRYILKTTCLTHFSTGILEYLFIWLCTVIKQGKIKSDFHHWCLETFLKLLLKHPNGCFEKKQDLRSYFLQHHCEFQMQNPYFLYHVWYSSNIQPIHYLATNLKNLLYRNIMNCIGLIRLQF